MHSCESERKEEERGGEGSTLNDEGSALRIPLKDGRTLLEILSLQRPSGGVDIERGESQEHSIRRHDDAKGCVRPGGECG